MFAPAMAQVDEIYDHSVMNNIAPGHRAVRLHSETVSHTVSDRSDFL